MRSTLKWSTNNRLVYLAEPCRTRIKGGMPSWPTALKDTLVHIMFCMFINVPHCLEHSYSLSSHVHMPKKYHEWYTLFSCNFRTYHYIHARVKINIFPWMFNILHTTCFLVSVKLSNVLYIIYASVHLWCTGGII